MKRKKEGEITYMQAAVLNCLTSDHSCTVLLPPRDVPLSHFHVMIVVAKNITVKSNFPESIILNIVK